MTPLFKREGSIAICRGCGRVYEGAVGFAITHAKECRHQRLFDSLYRLECTEHGQLYESVDRANVVFAILGEPSVHPVPEDWPCETCSVRRQHHASSDHVYVPTKEVLE